MNHFFITLRANYSIDPRIHNSNIAFVCPDHPDLKGQGYEFTQWLERRGYHVYITHMTALNSVHVLEPTVWGNLVERFQIRMDIQRQYQAANRRKMIP